MAGEVLYLDSSALVKLVLAEAESGPLRRVVAEWPRRASSIVAAVEVPRTVLRQTDGSPLAAARAEEVVARVALVALDSDIARAAVGLGPGVLRSLDAIHLASALSLGDDLGSFIAYDRRLVEAASKTGLTVLTPR